MTPASGRRDHTASPSASAPLVSRAHPRPPHPALNARDDRDRPSSFEAGWERTYGKSEILESKIFSEAGIDRKLRLLPVGQISCRLAQPVSASCRRRPGPKTPRINCLARPQPRHCERSAAIQSHAYHSGLPRRFAPRNDGGGSGAQEPHFEFIGPDPPRCGPHHYRTRVPARARLAITRA